MAIDDQTNRVFVTDGRGRVVLLDASTGAVERTITPILGTVTGALALDDGAQRVYVATENPRGLTVLDGRSGTLVRTLRVPARRPLAPALVAPTVERIFVPTIPEDRGAASISIVDRRRLALVRTVTLRNDLTALGLDEQTARLFAADMVRNTVDMLDARSGAVIRTDHVAIQPIAMVVSEATSRIFVIGGTGVAVLDAKTGHVLRTVLIGTGGTFGMVTVPGARVFVPLVTSFGSFLSVLDAHTGNLLHYINLDPHRLGSGPAAMTTDGRRRRVYMVMESPMGDHENANGPGAIAVLDAATGVVRRRVTLGDTISTGSGAVTFDAQTQRLFVFADYNLLVLDATRL